MYKHTLSAILLLAGTSMAQAATISVFNFENAGSHGDVVSSIVTTDGVITADVTATGGANEARIFDTRETGTAEPGLEGRLFNDRDPSRTINARNALIVQEDPFLSGLIPDAADSGAAITFDFGQLVAVRNVRLLDDATVRITGDNGVSITRTVLNDGAFRNLGFRDRFYGVRSLTFEFVEGSGALDRLRVEPVPLPASMPLMVGGLAGLGFLGRRKRRS